MSYRIAIYRGLRPWQRVRRPFGPMSHKIATYRGLRPRQRVYRPFGPMGHKMLFTGAFLDTSKRAENRSTIFLFSSLM
jgi:hypothetical protein